MARTPLMRALGRLANEHHAAEALQIPPAELRERRAEALYTRRQLVGRAAAVGAAAAIGRQSLARAVGAAGRLRASRSSAPASPASTRR